MAVRSSVFSRKFVLAVGDNTLQTSALGGRTTNFARAILRVIHSVLPEAWAPTDPVSSKVFSAETTPGHPTDMLSNIS